MFNEFFLLACYIILFIGGYYLLYFPSTYFGFYIKFPFIILFILLFSYITYVVSIYWKSNDSKGNANPNSDLFLIFKRFFFLYGKIIFILIVICIISVILYKILFGTFIYFLSKSLWFTTGLIILILALIKEFSYKRNEGNQDDIISLIKDIIFYIPCLITDGIDYLKQDIANTPSTTFIVLIFIIIYFLIFLIVPYMNKKDGNLIIKQPQTLDKVVASLSIDEIVSNNNPTRKDWSRKENDIYSDISYDIPVKHSHYPYDKTSSNFIHDNSEPFTDMKIKSTILDIDIEPFISIQESDANYNLFKPKQKDKKNKDKKNKDISDNDINNYEFDYKDIENSKIVHKIQNNINKVSAAYKAARDTINEMHKYDKYKGPYISNYALSFWVYFNTLKPLYGKDIIMTFDSRPSLYFDHNQKELIIEVITKDGTEEIYKTKEILYQRWNHIVINFNDSKLGLFINNNLVGFYEAQPLLTRQDLLIIGSNDNNNFGSICNFRYYNKPLQINTISNIYKQYNKKDPPI